MKGSSATWMRVTLRLVMSLGLVLPAGFPTAVSAQVRMIPFGAPGDVPVVGRWTGDLTTFIGVYRPSTGTFLLRTQNTPGPPDLVLPLGTMGDLPVVGHWCFSFGAAKPAVYRPSTNTFFLRCFNDSSAVVFTQFGTTNDLPVAGDWNGDGVSSIGVYRPSTNTFFLSNDFTTVALVIPLGAPGDLPVIRDFIEGGSLIGVYRPSTSTFFLSNSNTSTSSLTVIPFGAPGDIPLLGDWRFHAEGRRLPPEHEHVLPEDDLPLTFAPLPTGPDPGSRPTVPPPARADA